jgi:excisionase family DNA binding protein
VTATVRPAPLLLRIRDSATILAVSERTVWALIRSGDLRAVHPPGLRAIRIARDDIDALVARWRGKCTEIPDRSV